MRLLGLLLTCGFLTQLFASHAAGTSISFNNLRKSAADNNAMGVHIQTTDAPETPMAFTVETEGMGNEGIFQRNPFPSQNYTGIATFEQPISRITFDVTLANCSMLTSEFTLTAFSNGKRIKVRTVALMSDGDVTEVTLAAPRIDAIDWKGTNWVLEPYYVHGFHIQFADQTPAVGNGNHSVGAGSPVPEPGSIGLIMLAGTGVLLLRRRRGFQI